MSLIRGLEGTVHLHFVSNDTSGSGEDGTTPLCDVRLCGAAVDAAPVYSPTPYLLTHAGYPAGCFEVAIPCTAVNGFAAGNDYAAFCTLAVDGQNPSGFIGQFRVVATGDAPLTETGIAAAVEIDLSATHGAGSWLTGTFLGAGANVVTITMLDDSNDPVPGIHFDVRNSTETTLVATGVTDADGVAEVNLDDGSYKVRYGPAYAAGGAMARALGGGYGFDNPYTLTVSGTTTSTLAATAYSTVVGGLTFGQLKGFVRQAIRRTYPQQAALLIAGDLVDRWVNSAYQELDRKLRWSRAYVDLTTVADDEDYDFSVTVREIELVEYQDVSEDTVFELPELDIKEWLAKREADGTDSGTPEYFFRNGQTMYLYPVPDTAADTVRMWAIMEPSDLVGDEEKPPFMAHLHRFIVDLAMCHVMSHVGDFGLSTQTQMYVESQIASERLEPAVKRSGPDRILHDGNIL